jgi:hypothetical protein
VILGDIEASYFTAEQMNLLDSFVRERGGGVLMLGGVNSFGLGKYQDTTVARMLPFDVSSTDGAYNAAAVPAKLIDTNREHPLLRLTPDPATTRQLWDEAPPLIGLTPVHGVKAGAKLLIGTADGAPVLAAQNYGQGRVAAFTSGGSWYWQVSLPSTQNFHEKFWKQMMRWLAMGAKDRLSLDTDAEVYTRGKPVTIRATLLAKDLQPVNDATVLCTVTNAAGTADELPMEWTLREEGVYECHFVPSEDGDYTVAVRVEGNDDLKPVQTLVTISEPTIEFADAGLKDERLKAMAAATGGAYFTAATAKDLPAAVAKALEAARYQGIRPKDQEIWDMPALFLLALVLFAVEWTARRKWGLA